VSGAESASEVAVLPRMVEAKTRIMPFVAHPAAVAGVYMGRVGMSGLIVKIAPFLGSLLAMIVGLILGPVCGWCGATRCRRGTVRRDITVSDIAAALRMALSAMPARVFFAVLAECYFRLEKKGNRESQ
jgi:hypothetical protein